MKRSSASANREEANFCNVRIAYQGVPPATNQKTYKTTGSTSSEPIETHPKFEDFGTAANGATFDEDGKFIGFTDKSKSKFGVKSYLSGNLLYEETWVTGSFADANDLADLGNKSDPPDSTVIPSGLGDRNWVLISGSATPLGITEGDNGGKIVRQWRLSAKRGWDTDIYSA